MSLEADQFTQLMDKMAGIEAKVTSMLDKFQHDMVASQASSSQEVLAKLNKKAYQFKKKGNEAQFTFNCAVEDQINAVKKSLAKMAPTSDADKAALEKATAELDQGKEARKTYPHCGSFRLGGGRI